MTKLNVNAIVRGEIRGTACLVQLPKYPPTVVYRFDNAQFTDIDESWVGQRIPVQIEVYSYNTKVKSESVVITLSSLNKITDLQVDYYA
ncbi:hypothetical protein PPL_02108 [Heterostelium album PN500]|uniref:Uncharacterized protein n=1 Tax=Heterostelium pallidum (strain ATCC 26659 / Pp 5 / PN500) TaxID=670386 RepID=D3B1D7_HETP5|nr:hypothetical protein PPL_02108 [Heterostelium album PN500]EFA85111.1 hypothetical protein PPL_02108 [Heterostelium album PN500]|eukprot:XP_020437220.1 hypothetical protein PPL_02108 [Heterostelium album PN500]